MSERDSFKKICVRMPNWVGDAVMALPALKAIRSRFPSSELFIVTNMQCSEIYRYVDFQIDQILIIEKHRIFHNSRMLRRFSFDLIILFTNSFSSALESKLAFIKNRIGYSKDFRSFLLTERYKPQVHPEKKHHRYYYQNLIKMIFGIEDSPDIPSLRKINNPPIILQKSGWIKGRPTLGINPGAAYGSAKRWLPERFAEVAEYYINKKYQVILFSGKGDEADTVNSIAKNNEHIINLAGKTTLSELIEAIGFCNLFLTNDSGPMHLASALGIPIVAVFGPTDQLSTSPSARNYSIVATNEPCSPCMQRKCPLKHHNCMKNISSQMVIDALENLERTLLEHQTTL